MERSDEAERGARVLRLVRSGPDLETVTLLERLLHEARSGQVRGLVAITFSFGHAARPYDLSYSGTARELPTLAVGAMDVCQMLMREVALDGESPAG